LAEQYHAKEVALAEQYHAKEVALTTTIIASKDALILNQDERLGEKEQYHATEVARLLYDLDLAKKRTDARGVLEACVDSLWKNRKQGNFASRRFDLKLLSPYSRCRKEI
jgi:hypothetical protein